MHHDAFLSSSLAREIYDQISELPIIDFHSHLPQGEIANDHRFSDLSELWLKHDHYKWRLMRACGVSEVYCTGSASPEEKFREFARILPLALGNPVHHWAHMELAQVFGVTTEITEASASEIWAEANQQLQNAAHTSVRGLLGHFKVELVCTTDDPSTDLSTHKSLASDKAVKTEVLPTFRPDGLCSVDKPETFQKALSALAERLQIKITDFTSLIDALKQRHDEFHRAGCRLSDHGLPYCPAGQTTDSSLDQIFQNTLEGKTATHQEWEAFAGEILRSVGQWNHQKGWTLQLHLGPLRQVNQRLSQQTGPDAGFDTMGAWPQTEALVNFLDSLDQSEQLPRVIVYNLNPQESEAICCALQNFQDSSAVGKLQYGPAWWHLDHPRGIREQLDIVTNLSALGTSVGMLTDSRSFTSFARHDYYRRILSSYLAEQAQLGSMPNDSRTLGDFAARLAYSNARRLFPVD